MLYRTFEGENGSHLEGKLETVEYGIQGRSGARL